MKRLDPTEVRQTQLEVLDALNDFCDQQQITYYLCAGSLLGAVRHGGYIPWDDDIDVMLPRDEYQRFLSSFPEKSKYVLHEPSIDPKYPFPYAKLADRDTYLIEDSAVTIPLGVNVDIFPIDYWPRHTFAANAKRGMLKFLALVHTLKSVRPKPEHSMIKRLVLGMSAWILEPLTANRIALAIDRVAASRQARPTPEAGVMVWGYRERVPTNAYGKPGQVDFEGRRLPVPADSPRVLSCIYGNFMSLPPEHERVSHHSYEAFNRSETRSTRIALTLGSSDVPFHELKIAQSRNEE